MAKRIKVQYEKERSYEIVLEQDYKQLIKAMEEAGLHSGQKVCIVTDSNVSQLHLSLLIQELSGNFAQVHSIEFPAGEENKTLSTVQRIYEFLIQNRFDRSDFLIALGGGVVGDLTGYTAATYLRGISFVQIPSTLLSQVDSSIGGKTGVDFLSYKNMVGAFHQPSLVYMNLSLLQSLDQEQFICGMGEILKHGLIKNETYYHWLMENRNDILARDSQLIEEMVYESCLVKKAVVEADPFEKGERALLNFGHTIGHAIEKLSGFRLYHGQCVALGMKAAAYLSHRYGELSEAEFSEILNDLKDYGFPMREQDLDPASVLAASKSDKKMNGGKIKFILLKKIGTAYIEQELTDEQLLESILFLTTN